MFGLVGKKDKRKLAKKVVKVWGVEEKFNEALRKSSLYTEGADKSLDEDVERLKKQSVESIVDLYMNHLSEDALKGMLEFFNSKSGKEFVNVRNELEGDLAKIATAFSNEIYRLLQMHAEQLLIKKAADRGVNWSKYIPPIGY